MPNGYAALPKLSAAMPNEVSSNAEWLRPDPKRPILFEPILGNNARLF